MGEVIQSDRSELSFRRTLTISILFLWTFSALFPLFQILLALVGLF